ncbi:unnamed protein product, partial [Owenia fusiformis]
MSSAEGKPGEGDSNKPPSSQETGQDVAPPLITTEKKDVKKEDDKKKSIFGGKKSLVSAAKNAVGKKVVLTGEAVQAMAKQAKATRDDRRSAMDGRHIFLFQKIADSIGIELTQVEDFVLGDEKYELIDDFLEANGSKKLLFYYQADPLKESVHFREMSVPNTVNAVANKEANKRLFVTTGLDEAFKGICIFFLRTSPEKAITLNNIAQEINFGLLDSNGGHILDGIEKLLSRMWVPALKSQEDWGSLNDGNKNQVVDFVDQLEKFVATLVGAKGNMEGHIRLTENEVGDMLSGCTPADYQTWSNNPDVLEKLEATLTTWSKQIEQVLAESEQMRREADDIGPTAELAYWKNRMAKFNNLLDQIKTPRCKVVVGILHAAKSKTLIKWRELDSRITDAANEAKDNVKYLYTLDKFFGPLVKCNPSTMIEHIPSLMNAIRMIYSISQYYNTSERMTSLFVKVTNQMITTCKAYILQGVTKIWEHPRSELLRRLQECSTLNEAYQKCFQKTKQKLQDTPKERQFEFSENYIFGKFDTFCQRLEKISDMVNTMEHFSGLGEVRIEGIETIAVRFKTIVDATKKKSYDILDHRKGDFDNDYLEFKNQIKGLQNQIQSFVDMWFEKSLSIDKALQLLEKFEKIGAQLDLSEKYNKILHDYGKDLEAVRKIYQKSKSEPPIARNLPPVAGKIAWARQLYRRIESPMKIFKKKSEFLRSSEAKKIVRNYNKMAAVLMEFEMLYHRGWFRAVDAAKSGLNASLLVKHPETKEIFVNFDPQILELIQEAKHLKRLNLEIPETAVIICVKEDQIKTTYVGLTELLKEYNRILDTVPPLLMPLMDPYKNRILEAMKPGLTSLSWTSLNVDTYVKNIYKIIANVENVVKQTSDILECRIDAVLEDMSLTPLCELPEEDPVTVSQFLAMTDEAVEFASEKLSKQSQLVEKAMNDLIHTFKSHIDEKDQVNLSAEEGYTCIHPDSKHKKQRCLECQPCSYYTLLNNFTQRNTDALIKSTRLSLDAIKRRLQTSNKYISDKTDSIDSKPPMFKADIVLAIPNVVMRPSLEDIQGCVNKSVQCILKMSCNIPQWKHQVLQQKQQIKELEATDDKNETDTTTTKIIPQSLIKPLHKMIAEHKDVTKIVIQLNSIISTFKLEVNEVMEHFTVFSKIWNEEASEKIREFLETNPILSEFEEQIKYYLNIRDDLEEIQPSFRVGSVVFMTDSIKVSLIAEVNNWVNQFGNALNDKCVHEMDEVLEFTDNLMKRLSRPINDLDDVRAQMASLTEIRQNEIRIQMTITPIEEAFIVMQRYQLSIKDRESAERVDTMSYNWKKLCTLVLEVQDNLITIQPKFKSNLLDGVIQFMDDVNAFVDDYNKKGPMEDGIIPREASDRLTLYQARFDELWRKYQTYSGGEELFGLPVTEYPELQKIRKELNLLQKLYSLYNAVLQNVNGYFDIHWAEIDIDQINLELVEFQNRCRKLPKALKEWQAYEELRKTIDDFNETCPLLEMMANKAMQTRHWDRMSVLTGHTFDVDSDNFLLRNLMEAPLLKNKEDIEDICISAVKEKDIEAKLKAVVNDWSAQTFQFAPFKTRGELLLKGDTTGETVALMEDSLMILGSLLSNRYNAPFKPKIQEWVQKLTGTTEIIENWLIVQNLWIYLEAVFVGGDIAKQLPQEAKRFQNIDKSWIKIMGRAHETTNVVQCCVGDDTLSQLLPHLL